MLRRLFIVLMMLSLALATDAKTKTKKVVKRDSITIYGRVLCEGNPVADVAVTDGFHIVKTDSLGRYAMASHKFQGVVYITTPSGYEPVCEKRIRPQFWHILRKKREVGEQHDFHLVKRDQTNHRMFLVGNIYLQNSNNDLLQFKQNVVPGVTKIAAETSLPTYSMLLGDLSNNAAWYSREFDVGDAVSMVASLRYPTMIYTSMGDQDHDGAVPGTGLTDYESERHYVNTCGPKYYSVNIGDVHYVVLDNTVFRNQPGKGNYPTEIVGRRNYDRFVTSDQLDWLRKDLALLKDKSKPVVVCMHSSTMTANSKRRISKRLTKPEYVDSLTNCFTQFKNVHFITSGAGDRRISNPKEVPNITEHAIASISGERWRTGNNGFRHINSAGTDAGLEIFDVEGGNIKWHHRALNGSTKSFRVYDMASVGAYYRDNLDVQSLLREHPKSFINYGGNEFKNYIYVNWWGFEQGATLQIFEDNRPLRVRQIHQADPLYVVTGPTITQKHSRQKPRFGRNSCQHMFRAQRTSQTSTIKVVATDPYGNVTEEIFRGNKPFKTN